MPRRHALDLSRALLVLCTFVAVASTACENPNPGTALGTFSVTSALRADTCGSAATPSPGGFDVTLSNDDGVVYWFPDNGAPSASGSLSPERTVTSNLSVADDVDETATGGGACTLVRDDTLTFTLAAGAAPASFTGDYSFTVSPAVGSLCADQLVTHGGTYPALPCTAKYTLIGVRQ